MNYYIVYLIYDLNYYNNFNDLIYNSKYNNSFMQQESVMIKQENDVINDEDMLNYRGMIENKELTSKIVDPISNPVELTSKVVDPISNPVELISKAVDSIPNVIETTTNVSDVKCLIPKLSEYFNGKMPISAEEIENLVKLRNELENYGLNTNFENTITLIKAFCQSLNLNPDYLLYKAKQIKIVNGNYSDV